MAWKQASKCADLSGADTNYFESANYRERRHSGNVSTMTTIANTNSKKEEEEGEEVGKEPKGRSILFGSIVFGANLYVVLCTYEEHSDEHHQDTQLSKSAREREREGETRDRSKEKRFGRRAKNSFWSKQGCLANDSIGPNRIRVWREVEARRASICSRRGASRPAPQSTCLDEWAKCVCAGVCRPELAPRFGL